MRLEFDFDYVITYVPYRHQNSETKHGRSRLAIDIVEKPASEVPLVAKIGQAEDRLRSSKMRLTLKEDGQPREVRFTDGRFFVERCSLNDLEGLGGDELIDEVFKKEKRTIPPDRFGRERVYTTGAQILASQPYGKPHREVKDDGGQAKAASFRQLAGQMLIIDGVLFEEVAEPILTFWADEVHISVREAGPYKRDWYNQHSIYGYSFGDTYNLNVDVLRLREEHGNRRLPTIEVYDPSVFTYDADTRDMSVLISQLHENLSKKPQLLPLPMLNAWIDLRDAYSESHNRITNRLIEAVRAISVVDLDDETIRSIKIGQQREPKIDLARERGSLDIRGIQALANKILRRWERRDTLEVWPVAGTTSSVTIDGHCVRELGSKGHIIDFCRNAGMYFDEAKALADSGKRVVVSLHDASKTHHVVATLDEDGLVELVSPVPEDQHKDVDARFREFVHVTREAKLQEEELMAFDIIR